MKLLTIAALFIKQISLKTAEQLSSKQEKAKRLRSNYGTVGSDRQTVSQLSGRFFLPI